MSNLSLKKVLTNELKLGMYISRLDRPWLETPFLFQGFPITTIDDIDELRAHCEYVYVDNALSDTPAMPAPRIAQPPQHPAKKHGLFGRLMSLAKRAGGDGPHVADPDEYDEQQPGCVYEDQVSLVDELGTARDTHDKAQKVIREMMTGLRTGGRLDLDVVQTIVAPMVDSVLRNNDALAWLSRLRSKDDYSYGHSIATSVYTIVLGRHIGYSRNELHQLGLGGLLLDVGKTKLPDGLLKKKDPLSVEELEEVCRHVDYSIEILEKTPGIDPAVFEMVRAHHERRNGDGYPAGLKGDEIPMFGQIGGLCDVFDALTTGRPYAETLSAYEAMRRLLSIAGAEFKSELVEQFIQCVGMFPTGSLVELSSGEVGVVISQNKLRRLRPVIMVILDTEKRPLEEFKTVDLREEDEGDENKVSLWIRWGLEPGAYGVDPADYYL